MNRLVVSLGFAVMSVLINCSGVLAVPVQTTIGIHVDPANVYSASGVDY